MLLRWCDVRSISGYARKYVTNKTVYYLCVVNVVVIGRRNSLPPIYLAIYEIEINDFCKEFHVICFDECKSAQ